MFTTTNQKIPDAYIIEELEKEKRKDDLDRIGIPAYDEEPLEEKMEETEERGVTVINF